MATPQNDITAINNYAGQYESRIRTSIFTDLDIANDLNLITNLTSARILPKYKANDGLRPYDPDVTEPDGTSGVFSKRNIEPRTGMKILKVVPEELRKTFLSEQLRANAKDYPGGFAQYFWDEQIKKQKAEINNNSYMGVDGQGVPAYDPSVSYTVGARMLFTDRSYYSCIVATTAAQTPVTHPAKWLKVNNSSITKGLGVIIAEEYAGLPTRNKIATGTLDATNTFDKVTNFYLSLPEEIRAAGGIIRCSQGTYDNYNMSALAKFQNGTSFLDVQNAGKIIGKSILGSDGKFILKPASWMSGSKRLIADINQNLYMGTDLVSDLTGIGPMIPNIHGYSCKMQMILAYQIADLEILFVNDQA
ncbi:hypothetical protein [Spirosoma sp.]|uniref:hypothetical protein n=1 Tax=Spirosoma sp. TaxID=1899569 RepID=UPI00260AD1D9|nr:hypothetical protein [Spirosoma sp.]MCX6216475.1 hypothetical protein [Spirosoma sp.]